MKGGINYGYKLDAKIVIESMTWKDQQQAGDHENVVSCFCKLHIQNLRRRIRTIREATDYFHSEQLQRNA